MNKLQKVALVNLCLGITGLLFVLIQLVVSDRTIRIIASIIALIVCLFLFVSAIFRVMIARRGGLHFNERDASIHKTAMMVGLFTLFLVFFFSIILSLMIVGYDALITIGSLNTLFLLDIMSWFIAESVAILIQYGWGGERGKQ